MYPQALFTAEQACGRLFFLVLLVVRKHAFFEKRPVLVNAEDSDTYTQVAADCPYFVNICQYSSIHGSMHPWIHGYMNL